MTARVTLSCDGAFDDGRMPCRGATAFDPATLDVVDLVDLGDVDDAAEVRDWSSTRTAGATRHYCPAHTRRRAARVIELDPRWSAHPAAARSAVLELLEADVAAIAAAGGRLPDRAGLADRGIDPAAFIAGGPR